MIEFSGVNMNSELNDCHVENCTNGACTCVWNYPDMPGRRQFNICAWHLKQLYEEETKALYGIVYSRIDEQTGKRLIKERDDVEKECVGLRASLKDIANKAYKVMEMLHHHGPSIVPHLDDTDDNPGQYLREAINSVSVLVGPLDKEEKSR